MFHSLSTRKIEVTEPLHAPAWQSDEIEVRVTVPAGFTSDGASIPWPLWPILGNPISTDGVHEKHLIPAVVHDWLCEAAMCYEDRVLGDAIFFRLLAEYEVPYWKRAAMYLGVRFYARFFWKAPL